MALDKNVSEGSASTANDGKSTKTIGEKTRNQPDVSHETSNERLLVIDGHSMAFRAFYALAPDNFLNSSGQYTNAIQGFMNMLMRLVKDHEPSHLAVAFDLPGGTFRTEQYNEYKAGRNEPPAELEGQFEKLQALLAAASIATLTKENYEADDILATLAKQGSDAGMEVLIVSGDRDSFQLIHDDDKKVSVLYPTRGVSDLPRLDAQAIEDKYLVKPSQYSDLAALVGEKADNLPGVPGVGPKTAAKWIQEYGNLESILDNLDKISGKVGVALQENIESVKRNRRLNRLLDDLDLNVSISDLKLPSYAEESQELNDVFEDLEFRTVKNKFWETFVTGQAKEKFEIPELRVLTDSKEISQIVGKLQSQEGRQVVFVTTISDLETSYVTGFGFQVNEQTYYFLEENLDDANKSKVKAWFTNNQPKVVDNYKNVLKSLTSKGFEINNVIDDLSIGTHLLTADLKSYTLDELGPAYLDFSMTPLDMKNKPGSKNFDQEKYDSDEKQRISESIVLTGKIHDMITPLLRETGAQYVLDTLELPLVPVLVGMENAGIAVSEKKLDELHNQFSSQAQAAQEDADSYIEEPVNLSSPKQLQRVLFEDLELPTTGVKKLKTGYSTNIDTLNMLTETTQHGFLLALKNYRDATKLKQMVETLQKTVAPDYRIHTTYSQNISATGRLSSTNPNLQNIPIRSSEGRKIRDAFIPGDAEVHDKDIKFEKILTADYSQIEMRILAHLAQDGKLIEAFKEGEDLHNYVGSHVFGVPTDEVTSDMRSKVKAMSYGLAYGLSSFGLSQQLKINVDEARNLISDYDQRFGSVRQYLRNVVKQSHKDGYTATIDGRRRYLPDLNSTNRMVKEGAERAALNAPIQGTAADIIKHAMLSIAQAMKEQELESRMLLQVHDELVFEIAPGEEKMLTELVVDKMSHAIDLDVPLEVQVGVGNNWGQAGH